MITRVKPCLLFTLVHEQSTWSPN